MLAHAGKCNIVEYLKFDLWKDQIHVFHWGQTTSWKKKKPLYCISHKVVEVTFFFKDAWHMKNEGKTINLTSIKDKILRDVIEFFLGE